eukprot:gene28322-37376_t
MLMYALLKPYLPQALTDTYGKAVDVWSVGCIFAELLLHKPFLRGDNPRHQLEIIVSRLGCPIPEKQDFITSAVALRILSKLSHITAPPFSSFFPCGVNPQALDLMQKMLQFHPADRITVDAALSHPYLSDYHGHVSEPCGEQLFNFDFEKHEDHSEMTEAEIRKCMYEEVLLYRPNPVNGQEEMPTHTSGK